MQEAPSWPGRPCTLQYILKTSCREARKVPFRKTPLCPLLGKPGQTCQARGDISIWKRLNSPTVPWLEAAVSMCQWLAPLYYLAISSDVTSLVCVWGGYPGASHSPWDCRDEIARLSPHSALVLSPWPQELTNGEGWRGHHLKGGWRPF